MQKSNFTSFFTLLMGCVSSAFSASVGQELVTNGSFESGTTGWAFTYYANEGNQRYANASGWVCSDIVIWEGAGLKCAMLQSKSSSISDYMIQTVSPDTPGLYAFSCVYAARVSGSGTFWGGTTTVTLTDLSTDDILPVAAFTTTMRHRRYEDPLDALVPVTNPGSYRLKFQTTYPGDRGNIIDLVSLRLVLPFTPGACVVENQFPDKLSAYEPLNPSVGDVISTNTLVNISRTTCAKLLGYKLYRYTAENNYTPAEPEIVSASSYTVSAEDLASPFRLVWVWQYVDREYKLDTSIFSRKCELTLSGYAGTETLTHFPLLIRLAANSPEGFQYGNVSGEGNDLRFTDANGNILPYEVDTWNISGESSVWVRVPAVTGTATKIYLYYGVEDKDLSSLPVNYPADVWSDHLGVWHMNIDSSDYSTSDSTGKGVEGPMVNTEYCDPNCLGMIGGAFTNSNTAYIQQNFGADYKYTISPMVFSAWTYNHGGAAYGAIWSFTSGYGDFEIIFEGNATKLTTRPSSSAHTVPTFTDCWRHLQVVYNDNKAKVYMDGELVSTHDNSAAPNMLGHDKWFVGQRAGSTQCAWKGALDELRFRTANFSDDWIKAEYDNQKAGSAFVTYGEVEKISESTFTIADRGILFDGTNVTLSAYIVPEEGKDALGHIVYGETMAMSDSTANIQIDEDGVYSDTLHLDWATSYYARWEAWTVGASDKKVFVEKRYFTTDGTPQLVPDVTWGLTGNVVTVSAEMTGKRGAGELTVSLYREKAGYDEELMAVKQIAAPGTIGFEPETLDWGADYTFRAEFVNTKEGTGAWTNSTRTAMVKVPSQPTRFNEKVFSVHSDIVLSGYRGSEQLRDIPVLIRLSAGHPAGFDPSMCGENGEYIRFTDELGGYIPHEVDVWNADGESLVWVRVPMLFGNDTKITLHTAPSNPSRVPAVDSREVWSEYLGVWHMDVASDWSVKESAAYSLDGSVKNGWPNAADHDDPSPYSFTGGAGIVGGSFTNSNWAYVRVPANGAFTNLTPNVTFSAWVRSAVGQRSNAALWNNKSNGTATGSAYGVEITQNSASALDIRGGGASTVTIGVPTITALNWHLVTVAYVGDTVTAYIDDNEGRVPIVTDFLAPLKFSSTDALALGQRVGWTWGDISSGPCNWIGNLDEMRIGTKTESADWVKACYDTVMNPDFAVPGKVYHTGGFLLMVK